MSKKRADSETAKKVRRQARRTMPNVRRSSDEPNGSIIAVVIGDVHLSHKAPIARSCEANWYGVQRGVLQQIRELIPNDAEVLYVGDIFHHWNSPPELINFALKFLPKGISIPGQHDLPNHRVEDIKRSAYWTLNQSGCLEDISDVECSFTSPEGDKVGVNGFPWEAPLHPPEYKLKADTRIALIHKYIWINDFGYPNAPVESRIDKMTLPIGFDYMFFGDNHTAFTCKVKEQKIINCGSIINRNTDQRHYKPRIWFLYSSGEVKPCYLDTSRDKWIDPTDLKKIKPTVDLRGLAERFKKLATEGNDFQTTLKRMLLSKKVRKGVKMIIRELLEDVK